MYGRLKLVCGPMFSGKTTELLKNILWAKNGLGRQVAVYKTSFDDRYAQEEIMNHDGLQVRAQSITQWEKVPDDVEMVFFDEVQFFTQPQFNGDLKEIVHDLLYRGIDVMGAGLDMDAEGRPFEVTAYLMAMADDIIKLNSHCSVCGQPATKTFRKINTHGKASVQLGGNESYEPRCTKHWAEGIKQEDLFEKIKSA